MEDSYRLGKAVVRFFQRSPAAELEADGEGDRFYEPLDNDLRDSESISKRILPDAKLVEQDE